MWAHTTEDTRKAFGQLVDWLGPRVVEVTLPPEFDDAHALHRMLIEPEIARSFTTEFAAGKQRLSALLRQIIEHGRAASAVAYLRAREQVSTLARALDDCLAHFDAVLTPATPGEAPLGLQATGSPVFCTIWTLCGVPAVSIPLLQGADGMPLGVQLVGRLGADARLLRTARWLTRSADAEFSRVVRKAPSRRAAAHDGLARGLDAKVGRKA
jgi:Asp-tRNA(Asn)/Glu-tRNA(Gln) amidotransferase A subunit family amidase